MSLPNPPDDLGPLLGTASSAPRSATRADDAEETDLLGVVAIVLGCVGIVVAGIVMCILVGWLAAIAGARARESGRSMDNAYIAFVLAAVDGAAWIALHVMFDMHFLFG